MVLSAPFFFFILFFLLQQQPQPSPSPLNSACRDAAQLNDEKNARSVFKSRRGKSRGKRTESTA